jgi:hypothetical protein
LHPLTRYAEQYLPANSKLIRAIYSL